MNSSEKPLTLRVLLFSSMAFLLAPVAVFASHGVVPLVAIAAVFSLADPRVRQALHPKQQPFYMYLFILAVLWALITVVWTIEPFRALRLVGSLTALLVIARVLAVAADQFTAEERNLLAKYFVIAGVLLGLLLAFETAANGPITRLFHEFPGKIDDHMASLNPGSAILAVVAWPLAMAAARWRGWRLAVVVLAAVVGVLFFARSNTPFLALSLSVLLFPVLVQGGRWAVRAFSCLAAGFLIASPFFFRLLLFPVETNVQFSRLIFPWYPDVAFPSLSRSWEYRTWIWRFVTELIEKQKFLGWGLDASRFIEGGREPVKGYELNFNFSEVLPLHPHNAFLQIWLELGGVGAVLIAAALGAMLFAIGRTSDDKKEVAAFFAMAITYLVMGQASFGVWQNWWLSTAIASMSFFLVIRSCTEYR